MGLVGRLGLRIGICVMLSQATSEGATIALNHNAITVQLEHDVQVRNRATEVHFANLESDLRQQRFGTLLKDIEQLSTVLKDTTGPLDNAREIRQPPKTGSTRRKPRPSGNWVAHQVFRRVPDQNIKPHSPISPQPGPSSSRPTPRPRTISRASMTPPSGWMKTSQTRDS